MKRSEVLIWWIPDFLFYYAWHNTSFLFAFISWMKKMILLLITITTFTNVSYASFPVVEIVSYKTGSMTDPLFPISFYISGIVSFILLSLTMLNFLKNGFRRRQWWLYLSSGILFIYFAFWFVAPLLWMAFYFLIIEGNF